MQVPSQIVVSESPDAGTEQVPELGGDLFISGCKLAYPSSPVRSVRFGHRPFPSDVGSGIRLCKPKQAVCIVSHSGLMAQRNTQIPHYELPISGDVRDRAYGRLSDHRKNDRPVVERPSALVGQICEHGCWWVTGRYRQSRSCTRAIPYPNTQLAVSHARQTPGPRRADNHPP